MKIVTKLNKINKNCDEIKYNTCGDT